MSRVPQRHAGGIVFRTVDGEPVVLLVTAKGSRRRWVLPKGRVKRGENISAAALREVKEEAAVTGRVVGRAGRAEYTARGRRLRIDYCLIRYARALGEPEEEREREWLPVEDAIARLTYAHARRVLLEAHPAILARSRGRRAL